MSGDSEPCTAELLQKLERADSQLALYARDLKRMVDLERQKARELAAANDRLRILDRLKTDFLSFICHELRTPLSLLSMVKRLDSLEDPEKRARLMKTIQNGYTRLQNFIEKGLEYFSWLGGARVNAAATTELREQVVKIAAALGEEQGRKDDIQVQCTEAACQVRGEAEHLAKVVRIVIDNAIKFSSAGERIAIELRQENGKVVLAVADQGKGIPPEMVKEIFRPFSVSDILHHSKGTGLSLCMASSILEAFGGRIHARSGGEGKGSVFTVEFAAPAPQAS